MKTPKILQPQHTYHYVVLLLVIPSRKETCRGQSKQYTRIRQVPTRTYMCILYVITHPQVQHRMSPEFAPFHAQHSAVLPATGVTCRSMSIASRLHARLHTNFCRTPACPRSAKKAELIRGASRCRFLVTVAAGVAVSKDILNFDVAETFGELCPKR